MWEEQQRRARRPAAGSEGATRSALTVPIEGETLRQYTERLVTLPEEQRTALGPASVLLAPGPDEFLSAFPPQHGQPLPDPNAGRDLRASIAGAPLTNALLDMIGGAEAPGGYNQRVGDRPGRHTNNLTSMTINQVIALPEVRVGRIRSSASGRYQFLDSTLGQLVEELGLTGDEVFTPAMQDRLAYALLVRRGYLNLLSGAMGPEEFANALSQEWAAVPVVGGPRHGASYYADDGTNQALIDPSQLLLMILKQRQG
jgi:muramidase (phage lysozyme)